MFNVFNMINVLTVKAGGMRIARPRQASGSESKEKTEMTKEEIEEYGSRSVSDITLFCFYLF